jgi:tetratricopeptide (TPR) repeat protein
MVEHPILRLHDPDDGLGRKDSIDDEVREIDLLISEGSCESAHKAVLTLLRKHPEECAVRTNAVNFLMEIGERLKDKGIIESALEEAGGLVNDPSFERYASHLNFALGAGHHALYVIEIQKNNRIRQLFNYNNLQMAKKYDRASLKLIDDEDLELRARTLVNLGNTLDTLGRREEALAVYDEALDIRPDHAMAMCNKAMALVYYARICGVYEVATILEAHRMLDAVLGNKELADSLDATARQIFEKTEDGNRRVLAKLKIIHSHVKHKKYDESYMTNFERLYMKYCSDKNLFLNLHVVDRKCEASIVDPLFISYFGPLDEEDRAYDLFRYFNQIKEDFITARMMLVESQYRRSDFDRISRRTTLINTLDYSVFNIYVGYLKCSFKQAFGILDKIAVFINRHFQIGLQENRIAFDETRHGKSVWISADGTTRQVIVDSENESLLALYDIFRDFQSGEYQDLKDIRNSLVHRRLVVHRPPTRAESKIIDKENIQYDELLAKTEFLLKLVKSSIVYLLAFVEEENAKKQSSHTKLLGKLPLDDFQYL